MALRKAVAYRLSGLMVLSIGLALAGCALNYVDATGARHILGLTHVTIPPSMMNLTAESVRIQTIGLSVYESPLHRGVVLGYSDEALTVIGDAARPGRAQIRPD